MVKGGAKTQGIAEMVANHRTVGVCGPDLGPSLGINAKEAVET